MTETVTKLQTQIDDATGMTDFGTYVPDLTSNRKYLPDDYKTADPTGMQDFVEDIAPASVSAMMTGDLLERDKKQAAINRALGELAYKQASNRFSDLQSLVDKAGSSSLDKPKERENLMARIQAEQLMLQNEQIKLASIAIAQQAEAQLVREKKKQLILKSMGY
jgi:type IV secretion system protein VirB5